MDRIWGIWRSYSNIPEAIFYLLKGDYSCVPSASLSQLSGMPVQLVELLDFSEAPCPRPIQLGISVSHPNGVLCGTVSADPMIIVTTNITVDISVNSTTNMVL